MHIEVSGELILFKALHLGTNDNTRRTEDYSETRRPATSRNAGKRGFVIAIAANPRRNTVPGSTTPIRVGTAGWSVRYMPVYADPARVLCTAPMGQPAGHMLA
jgi:hypothetical protein